LHGTYPELLGKLVRERKWLDLPTAIHKSTGKAAGRLGLADRGLLQPGYLADIAIFDANQITSAATYQQPSQDPLGVKFVIKRGEVLLRGASS
jgi:N-acyl-D-aspartate/D-glutamate deacylase